MAEYLLGAITKRSTTKAKGNGKTKLGLKMLRSVDETLWRQIKAQAALEGCSMTRWVEDAMRMKLKLAKRTKT